jgi:hypothetical protein
MLLFEKVDLNVAHLKVTNKQTPISHHCNGMRAFLIRSSIYRRTQRKFFWLSR